MQTKYILLTLWIVVVLVWLFKHFYYQNMQRDLEYRKAKYAKKQQGG